MVILFPRCQRTRYCQWGGHPISALLDNGARQPDTAISAAVTGGESFELEIKVDAGWVTTKT